MFSRKIFSSSESGETGIVLTTRIIRKSLGRDDTTFAFFSTFFPQRLFFPSSTSVLILILCEFRLCCMSRLYIWCCPVHAQVFTTSLDTFAKS